MKAIRSTLAALLAASPLLAQLRWEVVPTPQAPPARFGHAIAGDGFLFGGRDATQVFSDSWNFEPWGWRQVTVVQAPSPRSGHAMAGTTYFAGMTLQYSYLLFGGETLAGTKDGSTWRFIGSYQSASPYPVFTGSWQPLSLATAPSPRSGHAMAYDYLTSSYCCLFGGDTANGPSDETWVFANGTWQLIATSPRPPARSGHALLATPQGFVLTGGSNGQVLFDDRWLFNGTSWQWLGNDGPAGDAAMAAPNHRGRTAVLTTTTTAAGIIADLREYTHAGAWLAHDQVGTLPTRSGAAVCRWLQPALLFLFGGRDAQGQALGDTLQLVPVHVASTAQIGSGCGPGAWGNDGPNLFVTPLVLGSAGTVSVYTASTGVLVAVGLQLGAASPPAPCEITVVPELLLAFVTDNQQLAQFSLAAPFSPALRGLEVSLQALAFEPMAPTGIAISRVGMLVLGD